MTKEEKFRRQCAREAALEETLLFHAREMEKILRKQMPKGWSMKVNMELMDETGEKFCGAECASRSGLNGQIGTSASVILTELLDKHNINYHIQNTTHHE